MTTGSLQAALAANELRMAYQPVWSLGPDSALLGAEGLLRWWHPTEGLLYPENFSKMLHAVPDGTARLLRWQLESLVSMTESHAGTARWWSINTSPEQALSLSVDAFSNIAPETRSRLALELPHTELSRDLYRHLQRIRAVGVKIIVDDYDIHGDFPDWCDAIKVSVRMSRKLAVEPQAQQHLAGVIQKHPGISFLVKGLELLDQMSLCKDLGFLGYQGYFLNFLQPEKK